MKATKKIVGAACALVAAVALSAGSTFAWFNSNKVVKATGFEVTAEAGDSLIISKTAAGLSEAKTEVAMEQAGKVTLTPTTMLPTTAGASTHYYDYNGGTEFTRATTTDSYYLIGLNDGEDKKIDPATGYLKDPSATLYYKANTDLYNPETQPDETDPIHYAKYTLYIASASGAALKNYDLIATIKPETAAAAADIQNAISVAYWVKVNDGGTSAYVETGRVKSTDNSKTIITNGEIPAVASDNSKYVEVTLIVYYDGDLSAGGDKAYVRNNNIDLDAFPFDIEFSVQASS